MAKKIIYLIIIFYFLIIFQVSFLPHFDLLGVILNLILLFIILINILEKPEEKLGIIAAFLGGLYLDIFSISDNLFFGFYALISVIISLFIKLIIKKHVQIPIAKKF